MQILSLLHIICYIWQYNTLACASVICLNRFIELQCKLSSLKLQSHQFRSVKNGFRKFRSVSNNSKNSDESRLKFNCPFSSNNRSSGQVNQTAFRSCCGNFVFIGTCSSWSEDLLWPVVRKAIFEAFLWTFPVNETPVWNTYRCLSLWMTHNQWVINFDSWLAENFWCRIFNRVRFKFNFTVVEPVCSFQMKRCGLIGYPYINFIMFKKSWFLMF